MVAPLVASLIVTCCPAAYVPCPGLNIGVAAGPPVVIVYAALPTALCVYPVATAIASIVSVTLTVIGPA